jgi:uncharacterized protein YajQ (UPF0234 family)
MRVRYGYRCDGGINPAHHNSKHIDINHDLDSGKITIGLNDRYNSLQEAEKELLSRYDFVELEFVQTTNTKTLDLVMKNEPYNYRSSYDKN